MILALTLALLAAAPTRAAATPTVIQGQLRFATLDGHGPDVWGRVIVRLRSDAKLLHACGAVSCVRVAGPAHSVPTDAGTLVIIPVDLPAKHRSLVVRVQHEAYAVLGFIPRPALERFAATNDQLFVSAVMNPENADRRTPIHLHRYAYRFNPTGFVSERFRYDYVWSSASAADYRDAAAAAVAGCRLPGIGKGAGTVRSGVIDTRDAYLSVACGPTTTAWSIVTNRSGRWILRRFVTAHGDIDHETLDGMFSAAGVSSDFGTFVTTLNDFFSAAWADSITGMPYAIVYDDNR